MKNIRQPLLKITLGATIATFALAAIGCEKKADEVDVTAIETEPAKSNARQENKEVIEELKANSEKTIESAEEAAQSAADATHDAIKELEGVLQQSSEEASKAGEEMKAILEDALENATPDEN